MCSNALRSLASITVGRQLHVRKLPSGQIAGVVGQMPAAQLDRFCARVVQFDPVGMVAIFVRQAAAVRSEKLINDDSGERQPWLQELDMQPRA